MTRSLMRVGMIALLALVAHQTFAAHPGVPRREYRGRTYYITGYQYYAPIWYAGDGVIKSRRIVGVPQWPNAEASRPR